MCNFPPLVIEMAELLYNWLLCFSVWWGWVVNSEEVMGQIELIKGREIGREVER
jgi:hypothetical protein